MEIEDVSLQAEISGSEDEVGIEFVKKFQAV